MDLKALADNLGFEVDEFVELAELFVETAREEIEALKVALDAENTEEVAKTAHSLKGAAGNLGFDKIYEIAQKIDADARNNILDGALERLAAIEENMKEIAALLNQS